MVNSVALSGEARAWRARAPLVSSDGNRAVVWLQGDQDMATAPALGDALARAVSDSQADLVVDVSGVTFMDAATVAVSGVTAAARSALSFALSVLVLAAVGVGCSGAEGSGEEVRPAGTGLSPATVPQTTAETVEEVLLPGDARVPEPRTSLPAKRVPVQPVTRITPPLPPLPPREFPRAPMPDEGVAISTETSTTTATTPPAEAAATVPPAPPSPQSAPEPKDPPTTTTTTPDRLIP